MLSMRKVPPGPARLAIMFVILVSAIQPLAQSAAASSADDIEPALRDAWSRGSERFQRQWLIAGPASEAIAAGIDAASAQPAAGQLLADQGPHWTPHTSWGDVIDLNEVLGRPTRANETRYAFGFATVSRKQPGTAELSLGMEGTLAVWVNGKQVHESSAEVFARDRQRIPVHFDAGENRILLRFLQTGAHGWRFAMRVVENGAVLPRLDEIAPQVISDASTLAVQTHTGVEADGPPVTVEVIAAGGRVVSSAAASRGEIVRFDSGAWPQGAYELRITTKDAWGRDYISHLPWYKGDGIAAARRLVEDARAAKADAAGATLRMLAEIVIARAGKQFERVQPDTWMQLHSALMEYEELRLDAAGRQGSLRPGGFVRLAYADEVDGSVQFCRAYLPLEYTPAQRWPLVINLHGLNPPNPRYHGWWSVDQRHSPAADNQQVILLEPHGRGNAQYFGIGERDVLRCLEEARKRFTVDEERVYLTGDSMGGHGTWWLASRHPHLFAAAAPVFGGWDTRIGSPGGPVGTAPPASNAREFFLYERQSSFSAAEGLLNVPLLVIHGDADETVTVEGSRHATRMLQRWGYDVRYHEMPGWGHEDLLQRERILEWLLTHRRNSAPRHVRLRSVDLEGAQAHWVSVHAIEVPLRPIRVDAEVVQPGLVRLDTENAAEVTLALPPELHGPRGGLKVVWNGAAHETKLRHGIAELKSAAGSGSSLRKRPGIEGPIPDIISTPFAVVVGTVSGDPLMRKYCRDKAEAFRELWQLWQHESPRIVIDTELTRADERKYSLILIGGADANAVTRRFAGRLPMEVTADTVTIDGRRWTASDAMLEMIYPSPVAADRYVLVVAATSAAGMYLWKPALMHPSIGFPLSGLDWTLRDGRRPPADEPPGSDDAAIAAGVFDAYWRRDDRWTIEGDAQRRAGWKLRRAPAPGYVAPSTVLEAAAGSYELFPGFLLTVANQGGQLILRAQGQPEISLVAESETVFGDPRSGGAIEFVRDADGRVTGVELENFGQTVFARRLR